MAFRRVLAGLIALMINLAAVAPCALAASYTESETDEIGFSYYGFRFENQNTTFKDSFYTSLNAVFTTAPIDYDSGLYLSPMNTVYGAYISSRSIDRYFSQSLYFSLDTPYTGNSFVINLPSFTFASCWRNGSGAFDPMPDLDFSDFTDEVSTYIRLLDSSTGEFHSIPNAFLPSYSFPNLRVVYGSTQEFTCDYIVLTVNFKVTSVPSGSTQSPSFFWGDGSFVNWTSTKTVTVDGTNETLDSFLDHYLSDAQNVVVTEQGKINTATNNLVNTYTNLSTSNINSFIEHTGSSVQESLDWGLRNAMIAVNNAGSQVTHAIGSAASSTVSAISAGAATVSQNLVAAAETVNTTVKGLPAAIGNTITGLMVPDPQELQTVTQEFNTVMENKLGAVYQIGGYGSALFGSIQNASATDTITFPGVSVPVGSGETFTIDSAEVSIFPSGLSVLQNCVKVIVTGAIVSAWFLGLQGYYNKFFGGGGGDE